MALSGRLDYVVTDILVALRPLGDEPISIFKTSALTAIVTLPGL
jgi:ABC-type arginine/histidine transport system permease subunit